MEGTGSSWALPNGDSTVLIQQGDHLLVRFALIQEELTDGALVLFPYLGRESIVNAALG